MSAAEDELTALFQQRDALVKGIQAEAPEEVMGVIESQQRGQLAALDAQIKDKADQYAQLAKDTGQAMADAIVDALQKMQLPVLRVGAVIDPTLSGTTPPVVPMADGGRGRATKPTLFYTRGNEDWAFSGEGQQFPKIDLSSLIPSSLPAFNGDIVPRGLSDGYMRQDAAQMTAVARSVSTPGAGGGDTLVVQSVLDGRVVTETVLKNFRDTARRMRVR
ncbi:MAG: hypothetical protein QM736_29835 [Vicinamibacterales bacterium]